MTKQTHVVTSILLTATIIKLTGDFWGVFGMFGGTLPDIDLRIGIKHRTITHSLLACMVLGVPLYTLNSAVGTVFISVYLLHLILDTCTVMGVPWLYPIHKKRYSFRLCKTGGTLDYSLFYIGLAAIGEMFTKI